MLYAATALALLCPQVHVTAPAKVVPELVEALEGAIPTETFRVYAALDRRLDPTDVAREAATLPRGERQQRVEERLRAFADAEQVGVLARLAALEAAGEVAHVRRLWITNTVRFEATPAGIAAIAALPEVAYVGWDPLRDPSELQDAGPAAPPVAGGGFTTYYFQGFEGGAIPPGSQVATTGCGSAVVTSAFGPKSGGFHLVMASTSDGCEGTATFGIRVDLSSATTARLRYAFKDMLDEFTSGADVLEASNDAVTWIKVADLTGSDGSYLYKEHSLDGLGLVYDSDVYLRWRWSDNFTPETDGFGIDDIEVADGFEPPPPPSPEVNLVGLQAPALWALGFNGAGAVLMNIDDGVDMDHPDLVNRIWNNPNDPIDGVDNDGNGYVDDAHGWDFYFDDNNPDGGGHGTNTAGIMVGDGSSGVKLTGMAPGASLVAARINSEADHWEALQYGLSIGIDCSSSSFSYKWYFAPKPDYHMHRAVSEMLLAAGIIHANSIGNDGSSLGSAPKPWNISAPGLCPAPWKSTAQGQVDGGIAATMGCGGIELNDTWYSFSGLGPSAWESVQTYDLSYPHVQDPAYFDYPVGGFGLPQQGLIKPDVVTYTNVATTSYGGGHTPSFGGTSAATPHLGGALALLTGAQPKALPRHVAQALQRTAVDLGAPGKDNQFGAGKVQVLKAAMRLFHLVTVAQPEVGIGQQASFAFDGGAGHGYASFWGLNQGSTFVGVGTLDLAWPFFLLKVGQLDASGHDALAVTLPNQPNLIGIDVYVQSVEDGLAGPFGSYLFSVVDTFRVTP